MTDSIFYFIMVPMVYIAFGVLLIGIVYSIARIVISPKQAATLQIFPEKSPSFLLTLYDTFFMPTIRKDRPVFWVFLIFFHIAFLLLILSHLDLLPGIGIMPENSAHMLGNGFAGVVLTASVIYFIFRRLKSPVREISVLGDYLLLFLLLFVFLTGDVISWSNSWNEGGFVIGKADFKNYGKILLDFSFQDPREVLVGSHYVVIVTHVFFANLFLMLFPFTKLMHTFLAIPINKLRRG